MLSEKEVQLILQDASKRIDADVQWEANTDHPMYICFKVAIESDAGHPIFVNASLNRTAGKMTVAIIHQSAGKRIYGLCLGIEHRNPSNGAVGEKHKHKWSDDFADKTAYVPNDITATIDDPISVWEQFCIEARIVHSGKLPTPPPHQMELL